MFKRISILLATFTLSLTAHATLIDFTDQSWLTAINDGSGTTASLNISGVGQVTLTSIGGDLTFNNSPGEIYGCSHSAGKDLLACDGDGIGIGNDEITELKTTGVSDAQSITISFDSGPVNINNIYLLDLFVESGGAETAVITSGGITEYYTAMSGATGGFYDTGFYGQNITSIILSGNYDFFSDYALAAIDVELSPVPVPGAAILFGSALLGFFGFKRRRAV